MSQNQVMGDGNPEEEERMVSLGKWDLHLFFFWILLLECYPVLSCNKKIKWETGLLGFACFVGIFVRIFPTLWIFFYAGLFRLIAIIRVHLWEIHWVLQSWNRIFPIGKSYENWTGFCLFPKIVAWIVFIMGNYQLLSCCWKIKWELNWVLLVLWGFLLGFF